MGEVLISCTLCGVRVTPAAEQLHADWHQAIAGQLAGQETQLEEVQLQLSRCEVLEVLSRWTDLVARASDRWEALRGRQVALGDGPLACPGCGGHDFALQLGGQASGRITCRACRAVLTE